MSRALNLALVLLFPLAWFAPLLRAGVLPIFGLSEISVLSGLQSLWSVDAPLALVVTICAIFAPMLKVLGRALRDFELLDPRAEPALALLGKLAMADVFLIALYVVIVKGVGLATVEVAWGTYLFTALTLISILTGRIR